MIDLEAIKKHRALWEPDDCTSLPTICEHVDALVAEVEQLRSENQKLRDVLEWVNVQCPGKCSGVCDAALRSGYHDKEKQ